MFILTAATKTIAQLPRKGMRGPLILGVILTALAIAGLGLLVKWGASTMLAGVSIPFIGELGGAGEAAGWIAGIGAIIGSFFIFFPAASAVISMLIDPVARAVEARHYPDAPPARELTLAQSMMLAVKYVFFAILLNLLLLPFWFIFPPLPAFANAWLFGRQYFELASRRRHDKPTAAAMRRKQWFNMALGGAMIAMLMAVPVLNLIAPIFGAGLMTHLSNHERIRRGRAAIPR